MIVAIVVFSIFMLNVFTPKQLNSIESGIWVRPNFKVVLKSEQR